MDLKWLKDVKIAWEHLIHLIDFLQMLYNTLMPLKDVYTFVHVFSEEEDPIVFLKVDLKGVEHVK
jgi:hypothetical protein